MLSFREVHHARKVPIYYIPFILSRAHLKTRGANCHQATRISRSSTDFGILNRLQPPPNPPVHAPPSAGLSVMREHLSSCCFAPGCPGHGRKMRCRQAAGPDSNFAWD
ncbi:hypothetical protein VTJ04DRAFT_7713 [Mycothermus thermophilus]|uniref:uncharacterized protein n=1 Tax=Humicola insolens TaxID=85995 RepID=UPI003742D0E2